MSETVENDKVEDVSQKESEEQTEGLDFLGKLNLLSWIPSAEISTLVSTAKNKTFSTLETVCKDIGEFSDTVQQEACHLASATTQQVSKQAQMIQHLITSSTDETSEAHNPDELQSNEITNADDKQAEGSGFFTGLVKQITQTVQRMSTEDTTQDEDEFTEKIQLSRKTILDQCTLLQMQSDKETFIQQPVQKIEIYREWLSNFNITEYGGEINLLLSHNPQLREIYSEIVPSQIESHTFWNRYFFKVHLKELERQDHAGHLKVSTPDGKGKNLTTKALSTSSISPESVKERDLNESWSVCGSSVTAETEDLDVESREIESSTPKPPQEDEVDDDWEECNNSVVDGHNKANK